MLIPQQRYEVERRLQEVRQMQQEARGQAPKRELPLLYPGQIVRVQDPRSKRWNKSGSIVNFGKNDREYMVKIDGTIYRRNRAFLKPQDVKSSPPLQQPAQAPAQQPAQAPVQAPATLPAPIPTPMPTTSQEQPTTPSSTNGRPRRSILKPVRFRD